LPQKAPIDQNVRTGSETGKPIVLSHPDSPVAKALTEITQKIAAKISVAALRERMKCQLVLWNGLQDQ